MSIYEDGDKVLHESSPLPNNKKWRTEDSKVISDKIEALETNTSNIDNTSDADKPISTAGIAKNDSQDDKIEALEPFSTVADMIASTTLTDGQPVEWLGYYTSNDGGGNKGIFHTTPEGTEDGGKYFDITNGGQVTSELTGLIDVAKFGLFPGGSIQTDVFNKIIDFGVSTGFRSFFLNHGNYRTEQLNILSETFSFEGRASERSEQDDEGSSGTVIEFHGNTGSLFELGTDSGNPWDSIEYDGIQGFKLKNLRIVNRSPLRTTELNCRKTISDFYYSIGSFGIKDWRGGHVELNDVQFEGFEYSVWGIQSDHNKFTDFRQSYCKYGVYLGPRSDQFVAYGFSSFFCDTVMIVDRASVINVYSCQTVVCGSELDYTVRIKKGSSSVNFQSPWLENFSGEIDCLPFFDVGALDGYDTTTTAVNTVNIINPHVATNSEGQNGQNVLIEITSGVGVLLDGISAGRGISNETNLTNYITFPSGFDNTGNSATTYIRSDINGEKTYKNNGTGSPKAYLHLDYNATDLRSNTGRLIVSKTEQIDGQYLRISNASSNGRILIETPDNPDGQSIRFNLKRIIFDAGAMPTSGTYQKGDHIRNNNVAVLGAASSQYILDGWSRLTDGSNHVLNTDWVERRVFTGT